MTTSKPVLITPLLLVLASLACTLPVLDSTPTPTVIIPQTILPESLTSAAATREPAAGEVDGLPVLEPYDDVSPHYAAMRPGFDDDVDQFAESSRAWVTLDMIVQDDGLSIVGTEYIRFVNDSPDTLGEIVLRIVPNAIGSQTTELIGTIQVDGVIVDVAYLDDTTTVTIPLPAPLPSGQQVLLSVTFLMNLEDNSQLGYGRIAYWDGQATLSSFIPMLSVYDPHSGWWDGPLDGPGDPAYSPVMLYDVRLRAPSDHGLAATGTVIEQTTDAEGRATYHIVTGPVRDVSVAMGPAFEVAQDTFDDVTISVWSLPGDATEDDHALRLTADSVSVFDRQFGAYPFRELDVIEAVISAGGIEYPGLIYIASNVWDTGNSFFDIVIVHETAHQWWYSMIGNNQVTEPWLDEGLTEYAVQVYYRETQGDAAGDAVESYYQDEVNWYLSERGGALPIGMDAVQYPGVEYRVFVYSGGALLFGQLEEEYGTEAMDAFLASYYDQYRYRNVTNELLGDAVEDAFGPEARAFFDLWVYEGISN